VVKNKPMTIAKEDIAHELTVFRRIRRHFSLSAYTVRYMGSRPASIVLAALACGPAFGRTAQTPPIDTRAARFEITDVHVTPKTVANPYMEVTPPRDGRYEFHSASMIDLIQPHTGFPSTRLWAVPAGSKWIDLR